MTVPKTLRTASQGQSMVCLSRRPQVSKHLSDGPLGRRPHDRDVPGPPTVKAALVAVAGRGPQRPPAVEQVQPAPKRPVRRRVLLRSVLTLIAPATSDQAEPENEPPGDDNEDEGEEERVDEPLAHAPPPFRPHVGPGRSRCCVRLLTRAASAIPSDGCCYGKGRC